MLLTDIPAPFPSGSMRWPYTLVCQGAYRTCFVSNSGNLMLEDVSCLELPGEVSTVLRLALPRFVHLQVRVGDPHAWHVHTEALRTPDHVPDNVVGFQARRLVVDVIDLPCRPRVLG